VKKSSYSAALFQIRTRILMEFAVASGPNVMLVGPPGAGKTLMINDFIDCQGKRNFLLNSFLIFPFKDLEAISRDEKLGGSAL
jgi:MoxR-like ATPase